MNKKSVRFILADVIYISMMIIPFVAGIVIKVLTTPPSEGINITGARVYFTVPMPIQDLPITEAQVNSALVLIALLGLCLFLTHGLRVKDVGARQHLAEWLVEKAEALVTENMGEYFVGFGPFIAAVLGLSAFSSLTSLLGLFPATSDINVVAGWAILVFVLITYYKLKCGPVYYLKTFATPAILTPMNIISEVATPVSMAFRHYGNVLSGSVISVLIAAGLQGLSRIVLGGLPGFLGEFPFLQIGIPAVLSIYFDVFSGCLQAYIFAMLTMLYVSGAFSLDVYNERKEKKLKKKKLKLKSEVN